MPKNRSKILKQAASLAMDLAIGAYPGFVYSRRYNSTPIFCFHGVDRDLFEEQLEFLSKNNYRTLTTDDMPDVISGNTRSVMLTFDDGWGSLWSIGLPLLKKYGMRIVIFLAAGRIGNGSCGPTLDDLQASRCRPEEVLNRDQSSNPLLTWDEVEQMHETGLVDFQSHTLTHTRAFSSPNTIDFVKPSMQKDYTIFQIPEWRIGEPVYPKLGRPIYPSSPRLDGHRRFIEDENLRRICEDYTADNGGVDFFSEPEWKRELMGIVNKHNPNQGRFESDQERIEGLRQELLGAKQMIEEHLPGKKVTHICYPWHSYSKLAVDISREIGYTGSYLGKMFGRYYGINAGNPLMIARVGCDFFFRLPGEGRHPLSKVLIQKIIKRK